MSGVPTATVRQVTAAPGAGSKNEPLLQRKCACGQHTMASGECEGCRKKRQRVQRWPAERCAVPALQRRESVTSPLAAGGHPTPGVAPLGASPGATDIEAPMPASTAEGARAASPPTSAVAPVLLADDDASDVTPGQLRKSEFLDVLETTVCAEADGALAATGRSTDGCPYLARWFAYYRGRTAAQVEAALRRYAPEARNARAAAEYIPPVAARVRRGVETWASSGEITGVPEGLPLPLLPGGSLMGAIGGLASGLGGLFFAARAGGARAADDPAAIQRELGDGQGLEGGLRERMEHAFGRNFSAVRLHTDATARRLSREQNARAFTVGRHVAFGAGEYRPGTVLGDALIAHELAHTVQQGGRLAAAQAQSVSGASYDALEADADQSTAGVVASLWGTAKEKAGQVAHDAAPALSSGLSLQRCAGNKPKTAEPGAQPGATPPPTAVPEETKVPKAEDQTPAKPAEPAEPEGGWCAQPTDHDGIMALRKKAGATGPVGTLAYGFTFWNKAKTTKLPELSIVYSGATGGKVTGKVEPTTTTFGTMEAVYLKEGTYEIPGKKFNVTDPQCGASGKQVPYFSTVSEEMSLLSRRAEQEHCDDYRRAFQLSYVQQAANINSLVGTTFGPGSKAQVKAEVNKALEAKGDKGTQGWVDEVNRLATISQAVRDDGRLHRLNPDGDPKKVDDKCTRKDVTTVPSATTKVPGPKTEDIIK